MERRSRGNVESAWKCFVIQPFDDGGPYDKRYDETFKPAIEEAGLEPYRIDKDPGVEIPIEEIERQIANSVACLADISTDNPNVWYELGYAMAKGRVVILICSDERKGGYPFDVRHRKVIKYSTKSAGGYDKLRRDITKHLQKRHRRMDRVANAPDDVGTSQSPDLTEYEVQALAVVAGEHDRTIRTTRFHERLKRTGLRGYVVNLASRSLMDQSFLEETVMEESGERIGFFRVTGAGMLVLRRLVDEGDLPVQAVSHGRTQPRQSTTARQSPITEPDDDLPF